MSTSASLTRLMRWPNSPISSSAVSWSMVSVIVTGVPILNSALTRSAPRSPMRLASSWTVIASGTSTSRTCFCAGPVSMMVALFLFAGAAERGERTGAALVLVGQRAADGELAALALLVAAAARASRLGALGRGRVAAAGRRKPRSSSSLDGRGDFGLRPEPRQRGARLPRPRAWPASRHPLRPCDFPRRGGALLPTARPWRGPRGGALPRGSTGALPRPRAAASSEAPCGWSSRPARTACAAAGAAALRRRLGRFGDRLGLGRFGAAELRPGRPRMRRFLTSTTTVFERPWLKLCLTLPVSTVRLRPSGGRVPSFGFSVWSAILFLRQIFVSRAGPQGGFSAFQTTIGASESPPPGKRVTDTRSGGGIGQRDMYHIFAPQCHRQDSAPLGEYQPPRLLRRRPARPGRGCGGRPRRRRRHGSAGGPCRRARPSRPCRRR